MKKKVVALMTIATMAASLFAGCGEQTQNVGGGTETGNQAASGEKETMNIHLNGIDEDYKMQKAIEEIQTMSEYQNVEFNFVGREADFNTTVPTQIAAGNQIDIIVVANPMLQQQYADNGTIIPLDDLIAETGVDFEEEFGKYAESAKNDGQTYMVPHNITSWALYYNKDVFDAAGVPYPDDTVPMTWEEYRETAKKITQGEGANKIYGAFYLPWSSSTYGEAIENLGGGEKFYTEDGLSNIEDPEFAKNIELVHDMMFEDESMKKQADTLSTVEATEFMNGNYGMTCQGGWVLPWAADKEGNPRDWKIGIAPLPCDSKEHTTWGIVNGLAVTPTSADPKLAFEICMDLTRLCAKYARSSEEANRTVEQNDLYVGFGDSLVDDGITTDQIKYVLANSDEIRVTEKIMGPANVEYEKVYMEEVEKYLVEAQDLETTIKNIKERADEAIKKASN